MHGLYILVRSGNFRIYYLYGDQRKTENWTDQQLDVFAKPTKVGLII